MQFCQRHVGHKDILGRDWGCHYKSQLTMKNNSPGAFLLLIYHLSLIIKVLSPLSPSDRGRRICMTPITIPSPRYKLRPVYSFVHASPTLAVEPAYDKSSLPGTFESIVLPLGSPSTSHPYP